MTRHGLIAMLIGMVLISCPLLGVVGLIIKPGQNILASIPISDELKLLLVCALITFGLIGLLIFPMAVKVIKENNRKSSIKAYQDKWGKEVYQMLLNKKITVGMTEEMVRLAWGNPNYIEDKELTQSGKTVRWIYGQPRRGANYIWFTNGRVTKVKS